VAGDAGLGVALIEWSVLVAAGVVDIGATGVAAAGAAALLVSAGGVEVFATLLPAG
jgi:hypothetical protein